jgi:cell division septal protein FtsQ
MKKQKITRAVKIPVIVLLILVIAVFFIGYIWHSFKRLDYFRIREVMTGQPVTVDLSYLKGQNIFTLDLRAQARYLYELYPVYHKIRLVRILPNRIFCDFIKRQPVAYVRLYKNFSVDEECVLFDAPIASQMLELPVIVGLETKILGPKIGKKFEVKELTLVLNIIKDVQTHRALRSWKLKKIDVTNPAATSFFIAAPLKKITLLPVKPSSEPEQFEVKVGEYDTTDKIDMLTNLLIQLKNDWINIKYIDLRFKEPVVKFKEKDAKK